MSCFVAHTSLDCRDAHALSEWWKPVLGYVDLADDPNRPGDEECMILDPETGHRLLFLEVPEEKTVKNRLHLDLRPRERTQAEEVEHLRGLGATVVADRRGIYGPDSGWVVLADPEGNEFCVLSSEAELAERAERAAEAAR
ncbi:VOC family protein [Nocardioides solisilvae]|uniref:VOC family protein n=1 Tax=Nocardioides solisilvae TaxID=1542435 RepID=UPI000D74E455|nr:VOC family protein [Nocardioides solisilvae]